MTLIDSSNLTGLVLQKCSSPVRLLDKLHGGYMYLPCGHCTACVSNRRATWARRMELEHNASVATLFFTLTYDNQHLPIYTTSFDNDDDFMFSNRKTLNSFHLAEYGCDKSDIIGYRTSDFACGYAPEQLAVCCKSDVQLFLKRLRRQIDYDSEKLLSKVPRVAV